MISQRSTSFTGSLDDRDRVDHRWYSTRDGCVIANLGSRDLIQYTVACRHVAEYGELTGVQVGFVEGDEELAASCVVARVRKRKLTATIKWNRVADLIVDLEARPTRSRAQRRLLARQSHQSRDEKLSRHKIHHELG